MGVTDILKDPQFSRSTPLDVFFQELNSKILHRTQSLKKNNREFVTVLLRYFQKLHVLTWDEQKRLEAQQSDMLPISLHDMKYVENFFALIVAQGFYANLPPSFEITVQRSNEEIPGSDGPALATLELVTTEIYSILVEKTKPNDYVRFIVLKGPLFTSTYLGLLTLYTERRDAKYEKMLQELECAQQSYELFEMYTLLVQGISNVAAKAKLLAELSTLTVRRDNGVLSLIDFVMGARENELLDLGKINRVTDILVAKPRSMSGAQYFERLFIQIYDGLSMVNRPIVVSCLNNVVATLYLKNRRIIRDFLFRRICRVLFNDPVKDHTAKELNDTINILISLTKNHCHDLLQDLVEGMNKRLFYLNLWIYALFLKRNQKINPFGKEDGPYYEVILTLLKSFVALLRDHEALVYLSMNLLNFDHEKWEYRIDFETQLAYITVRNNLPNLKQGPGDGLEKANDLVASIDEAIALFVELLKIINNEDIIKDIFLAVLDRWLRVEKKSPKALDDAQDNVLVLLDLKLLEKLHDDFSTDILKRPEDVLRLLEELLGFNEEISSQNDSDDEDSDDEECQSQPQPPGVLAIILQLLQSVLSLPPTRLAAYKDLLCSIDAKLLRRGNDSFHKVITSILDCEEPDTMDSSADLNLLQEATINLNDPSAPMQVLGLTQLIRLVQKKSPVVSSATLTQWFMQSLKCNDPYVYLTAIKGLSELCQCNESTLDALISFYATANRLDEMLKVGEVFIHYIQLENEMFEGTKAHKVLDACLANIRKRGEVDDRLRMSAMSILGVGVQTNARGIQDRISDMLDCSFGILQMESKIGGAFVVRRAAVHLIHDLLLVNAGTSLFPPQYSKERLQTLLEYTRENDEDVLVCDQATQLLGLIK